MKIQISRLLTLILSLTVLLSACGGIEVEADFECPVTERPDPAFIPPEYYEGKEPFEGAFWYGSEGLWTMLLEEAGSELPLSEDGFIQKLFWWADGYVYSEEPMPEFLLLGERLDTNAPVIESTEATNAFSEYGSSILTGVAIPTEGCWQISGRYRGETLSFVVEVVP